MSASRNTARPYFSAWPMITLATVGLLASCTGRPSVKSTWNDGAARGTIFTRLLVVGVSPDYTQRCNFEYWLVRDLRSSKLAPEASCNYMAKDEALSREGIEGLLTRLHADGVIATRMVASNWVTRKEGAKPDTRNTGTGNYITSGYDTGFYGAYGMPLDFNRFKALPSIMDNQGTGHLITTLYETRSAAVVYTIDLKVKDIESSQLGLGMVTPAIAERLRRDHLIQ